MNGPEMNCRRWTAGDELPEMNCRRWTAGDELPEMNCRRWKWTEFPRGTKVIPRCLSDLEALNWPWGTWMTRGIRLTLRCPEWFRGDKNGLKTKLGWLQGIGAELVMMSRWSPRPWDDPEVDYDWWPSVIQLYLLKSMTEIVTRLWINNIVLI
jgi:hypothetical protein